MTDRDPREGASSHPRTGAALHDLLAAFQGPDPLPAGGAAGIAALASGVAVAAKVLRISDPEAAEVTRLREVVAALEREFSADCAAFEALLSTLRLPREEPGREARVEAGWLAATEAPVRVARLAGEVAGLLTEAVPRIKPGLRGDVAAARRLVEAGLRIAVDNARENARRLDEATAAALLSKLPGS